MGPLLSLLVFWCMKQCFGALRVRRRPMLPDEGAVTSLGASIGDGKNVTWKPRFGSFKGWDVRVGC